MCAHTSAATGRVSDTRAGYATLASASNAAPWPVVYRRPPAPLTTRPVPCTLCRLVLVVVARKLLRPRDFPRDALSQSRHSSTPPAMASAFAPSGAPARAFLARAQSRSRGCSSRGSPGPTNPSSLRRRCRLPITSFPRNDVSRVVRSVVPRVLREDGRTSGVGDETAKTSSSDSTQIELHLADARAAAAAADTAACVAEKEHAVFLKSNKLLLDNRTAEAQSTRNTAARALEVAVRARQKADKAAAFATKRHEIVLEESRSEACLSEAEAVAVAKSKNPSDAALEDPDCARRERRAKIKREEAEHQAQMAASEQALTQERLVVATKKNADRTAAAAHGAAALADAAAGKQSGARYPKLWDSQDSQDSMDSGDEGRDEATVSNSRGGTTVSNSAVSNCGDGATGAGTSSTATGNASRNQPTLRAGSTHLYRDDSVADTIAPMPDWMYPRWLDVVPSFFGRLNPVTGALVYYTGAVLRESAGAPLVAAQWTFFVFLPILGAQFFWRKWRHEAEAERMYEESLQAHALATEQSETQTKEALEAAWPGQEGDIESDAKSSSKQLSKTLALKKPFTFYRKNRVAWLDLHLGYALLCPAGAVGGDGASWWLLLAPVVMSLRFVGEKVSFLKPVRRVLAVVGGVVALGSVLFSASASLTQALTSARGGGWVGWVLSPIALAVTYFVYLAPAALLPGAIKMAFFGQGEWLTDGKLLIDTETEKKPLTTVEQETERRSQRVWQVVGFCAFAVSLATGSDVPIFICFFAQLLKKNPGQMLQIFIDKGDKNKAAFDQKIADAAGSAFSKLKGKGNGRNTPGSAP